MGKVRVLEHGDRFGGSNGSRLKKLPHFCSKLNVEFFFQIENILKESYVKTSVKFHLTVKDFFDCASSRSNESLCVARAD